MLLTESPPLIQHPVWKVIKSDQLEIAASTEERESKGREVTQRILRFKLDRVRA